MSGRSLIAALAVIWGTAGWAEDIGDAARGEEIFGLCSGCHEVGRGAENGIGPHLNGIFGRRAASVGDGYHYSDSLRRAGADGLEWHLRTLDAYIENPKALVSGTRMSFDGLEDAGERADLLAYLRRFSDNPRDIPEADPTARKREVDLPEAVLAMVGDPEYGEYLSSECLTCHQSDGNDDGIPSITNWPAEDFVVAMHAYKRKLRPHPVMQMMAGRLSDEEIAALAAYFETIN
ncbi:c-type cytochrome [Roseovarius aestuariivivens]|uniref:c-type cytochrome n=1 Tax=Roseovarius aestuariivivens TaxID=1888910 RepID=UPI00108197CB|nr:c-type cytochrome [Roseovarius aestuariivivens]